MVEVDENATATLSNDATGDTYTCNLLEVGGNAMFPSTLEGGGGAAA